MKIKKKIMKKENGHDIIINNNFVFWIFGNKKNAEKKFESYLETLKSEKL